MAAKELKASYHAPDTTKEFVRQLPSLTDNVGVEGKTAFLSTLRTEIGEIQGDVNVYLTQRMDDERAAHAVNGIKTKTKEEWEEERYGEEDPEADG